MENQTTTASQSKTARLAGLLYLVAMATGLFAEFYYFTSLALIIRCCKTAFERNIMANERLYRYRYLTNNIICCY